MAQLAVQGGQDAPPPALTSVNQIDASYIRAKLHDLGYDDQPDEVVVRLPCHRAGCIVTPCTWTAHG